MPQYAFMRELEDGKWCVVIVGNIQNGKGEVIDANILPNEYEANTWRIEQIGDVDCVYNESS